LPRTIQIGLLGFLVALSLPLITTPAFSEALDTQLVDRALVNRAGRATIAIIIDDIGHNRIRGKRAIELPANLTYAVIPDTQHGMTLARYAHNSGKEVMVHLPMENTNNQPMGKLALTSELNEQGFDEIFDLAVQKVPFASGINNHMGSALTQQPQAMAWLMNSVKRHKLYFVDSRTTSKTVASDIAQQRNIMTASRDVFLDNERTTFSIDQQFRRLLRLAKRNQTAIAIGHPYPATLDYLEQVLPLLERENIEIVAVSDMLKLRLAKQQVAAHFMRVARPQILAQE
jgi:polysaccharide deacetylase 2 family uncharacterized protein YibQ